MHALIHKHTHTNLHTGARTSGEHEDMDSSKRRASISRRYMSAAIHRARHTTWWVTCVCVCVGGSLDHMSAIHIKDKLACRVGLHHGHSTHCLPVISSATLPTSTTKLLSRPRQLAGTALPYLGAVLPNP